VAEREPHVIGAADVRRVGDRHQQQVVAEKADGHGLIANGEVLRQQYRGLEVEVGRSEVDVLERVLVGERLSEVLRGDPAVTDDDLAEPFAGQLLAPRTRA